MVSGTDREEQKKPGFLSDLSDKLNQVLLFCLYGILVVIFIGLFEVFILEDVEGLVFFKNLIVCGVFCLLWLLVVGCCSVGWVVVFESGGLVFFGVLVGEVYLRG